MTERWRDVVGFESLYQVSSLGRVRSCDRVVSVNGQNQRALTGRVLKQSLTTASKRYYAVTLSKEGVTKKISVHLLVAEAFLGPRPVGLYVLHGEKGPKNNSVSNLKYGSQHENLMDCYRDGTIHSQSRRVRCSNGKIYPSLSEAARQTNTKHNRISQVCRGERRTTGGFRWEYVDE